MKLKTDIEIKALAKDSAGEPLPDKDLIAGFEEWFKNEIEKLSNQRTKQGDITLDAVITITMLKSNKENFEKLWQAAKLSSAKELERLQKENEELKKQIKLLEMNQHFIEKEIRGEAK